MPKGNLPDSPVENGVIGMEEAVAVYNDALEELRTLRDELQPYINRL